MRPHRAYVPEILPELELKGREARHLAEVLRARVGDKLTVFDGKGLEATALVTVVDGVSVGLRIEETKAASKETPQPITLYLALLKGDHMGEVVRAATELGAAVIVPTLTQHCVVRELGENKLERLRRIATEAAKQCERNVIPEVRPVLPLKLIPTLEQGLVAQPRVSAKAHDLYNPDLPCSILTGPEGGLSDSEVELLEAKGFKPVTLGPRILRAETAPVALLSLLTAGEGF
jgi:16S rRNA (uracil1498-N3)-methyltransferase